MFGRVPLFFYVLQWPATHVLARLFQWADGQTVGWESSFDFAFFTGLPDPLGFSLSTVYLAWTILLLALYPLGAWYARLKRRHRDRAWTRCLGRPGPYRDKNGPIGWNCPHRDHSLPEPMKDTYKDKLLVRNVKDLGARIRTRRVEKRLTQTQLAELSGTSVRLITELERGIRTEASVSTVLRVCSRLALDVAITPREGS